MAEKKILSRLVRWFSRLKFEWRVMFLVLLTFAASPAVMTIRTETYGSPGSIIGIIIFILLNISIVWVAIIERKRSLKKST